MRDVYRKSARLAGLILFLPAVLAADGSSSASGFTAAQLSVPASDGWLTNGGTLSNQRYSPLDQINRRNIGGMKALWHISLDSGKELRHNNQAQPLVHDGVIYISTGQGDVFAIAADDGRVIWEYRSGLLESEAFVCCQ